MNFILDESGSMSSITESVISGFNEYLLGLKKSNYKFTLTKFDTTGIRTPYVNVDIKDVEPLDMKSYQPGQGTPLYDAVCETIIEVEKEAEDKQPVLVAIMTDGEENSSKEYTQTQLKKMIKRLEAKGNWTFVFMGANQDSWATAQLMGIQKGNVANWQATTRGTGQAFSAMAMSNTAYEMSIASGGGGGVSNFFNSGSGGGSQETVSNAAQTLGSLGGQKTAQKGPDFYKKIGDLGRQSRYKK